MLPFVLLSAFASVEATPSQHSFLASMRLGSTAEINLKFKDYGLAPLPDPDDSYILHTHLLHCLHMVETMESNQDTQLNQWHLNHCQQDVDRAKAYFDAHLSSFSTEMCSALFPPKQGIPGMEATKVGVPEQRRLRGSGEEGPPAPGSNQYIWSRDSYAKAEALLDDAEPTHSPGANQYIWSRDSYAKAEALLDDTEPTRSPGANQYIWSRDSYAKAEALLDDTEPTRSPGANQYIWSRDSYAKAEALLDDAKPSNSPGASQYIWSRDSYAKAEALLDAEPTHAPGASQYIWSRDSYAKAEALLDDAEPTNSPGATQYIWSRDSYAKAEALLDDAPTNSPGGTQYIWSRDSYAKAEALLEDGTPVRPPLALPKKDAHFNSRVAAYMQGEVSQSQHDAREPWQNIEDLLKEMRGFYFGLLVFKQQQGLDEGDEWKYMTQSEIKYLMKWRMPQVLAQSAVVLACPRSVMHAWAGKSLLENGDGRQ